MLCAWKCCTRSCRLPLCRHGTVIEWSRLYCGPMSSTLSILTLLHVFLFFSVGFSQCLFLFLIKLPAAELHCLHSSRSQPLEPYGGSARCYAGAWLGAMDQGLFPGFGSLFFSFGL